MERVTMPKVDGEMINYIEQVLKERGKDQDISELSR